MNKLNQWLTLVANLSVVAGIVFLAAEMRQNTEAMRAQTRDSLTEKQMALSEWIGTSSEAAQAWMIGNQGGLGALEFAQRSMYQLLVLGNLREWEDSYYQYEEGLFTPSEFEARRALWVRNMRQFVGYPEVWATNREFYSPDFRAEIDRIVAEVGNAP